MSYHRASLSSSSIQTYPSLATDHSACISCRIILYPSNIPRLLRLPHSVVLVCDTSVDITNKATYDSCINTQSPLREQIQSAFYPLVGTAELATYVLMLSPFQDHCTFGELFTHETYRGSSFLIKISPSSFHFPFNEHSHNAVYLPSIEMLVNPDIPHHCARV